MNAAHPYAAQFAARETFGRLVAYLMARGVDLDSAEDALAEALAAALTSWREEVPEHPEAWLVSVARRKLVDAERRRQIRRREVDTLKLYLDEAQEEAMFPSSFPDKRLELMFVCAHPAIDVSVRAPLILQSILGLSAETIGGQFLVKPATMGQRLVRAKRRIEDDQLPFEVPDGPALKNRLQAVLNAIYATFSVGFEEDGGLREEALWLGRTLLHRMPDEPEVLGLMSLMLHAEARRQASRHEGHYVPLDKQDPQQWNTAHIIEAEVLLRRACRAGHLGRYQLEAAMQSVIADKRHGAAIRWTEIVTLNRALVHIEPTIGAHVALASALGHAGQFDEALRVLQSLNTSQISTYQPYWATLAFIVERSGGDPRQSYTRAAGLTSDPAIRRFLLAKAHNQH